MTKLHLLVDDDYIEEFVNSFDNNKVKIIEEDFEDNKKLLFSELEKYKSNKEGFIDLSENISKMSNWISEELKA